MDCLFCAIVAGDLPSKTIYQDDVALAFLDINPWQKGHALVIPKRHVSDFIADDTALAEVSPAIARVSRLLKAKLGAGGCNVLSNAGTISGQEVFHAHAHVIPRYADSPGLSNMRGNVEEDLEQTWRRITI